MPYKDPVASIERIRKSRRDWYDRNREHARAKVMERRKAMTEWYRTLKTKCLRCPENDPVCLVFHHRDPKEKSITIAKVLAYGWSKESILKEIAKCDILCANCHAKQHRRDPMVWETASKAV